jgi:predicted transcriptional regulator
MEEQIEMLFYQANEVGRGGGPDRNKHEDFILLLEMATIHPVGVLKFMHSLFLPQHLCRQLIKELVKEGLLKCERQGALYRTTPKGKRWLERVSSRTSGNGFETTA